ncbi:MAG: respiratory nitrate reductase subunit gamma [Spirochaetes bacterium]|nr:respiratory nitrate reductase subunit gamma [Spirochaetota bacterium]
MLDLFAYIVMVPMVYLAFILFVAGMVWKLVRVFRSPSITGTLGLFPRELPRPLAVARDAFLVPSAFRKDRVFWVFIVAFHAAVLFLILGHCELVWNIPALQVIPHRVFLGAGSVGMVMMIGTLYFLFRRFGAPVREISVPEDYFLLIILFLSILFGSILHLVDRLGIGAMHVPVQAYREYFAGLLTLNPRLPVMVSYSPHYAVMVIHIFFSNLFIMLFPFSKMIHAVFAFFAYSTARR